MPSIRPQVVDWPSAYVAVIPVGAVARTSFLGPTERGVGWPRLVGILQKKAGQAGLSGTSGACQVSGEVDEEEVHDPHARHALRHRLAFMRARETFIVPLGAGAADAGAIWFDLYDREPLWLDRELARAGLPAVADMTLQ